MLNATHPESGFAISLKGPKGAGSPGEDGTTACDVDIFVDGQRINILSAAHALENIRRSLRRKEGFTLFTANLDHLAKMRREKHFKSIYEQATYVTSDGWPVAFLARRKNPEVRRTTGADLVLPVCRMAAEEGVAIYLFGTTIEVLTTAGARLTASVPGLRIAGMDAPPIGFDPQSSAAAQSAERIAQSGAGLCFVALGAPKQEQFSVFARQVCTGVGLLCIGASLDFIAGKQRRAPAILQRWGLEWAWRLALSPRRLALRYIRCAMIFSKLLLMPDGARSAR